jgi:predicted phage-related endonuclease
MIERRAITSREEWLQWRREDVTASTVGALFGAHPYCTALRIYAEKRGTEFVNEDNKILRRGRWLEPAVAKAVEEMRPEWKLIPPMEYLRDPVLRIGATPDFYIEGDPRGRGVLQAKSVAQSVYARDWDNGNEVPLWIILQAQTEMMQADAAFGAVAALLVDAYNMDVCIHELPRHAAAEDKIKRAVAKFWDDVANAREPEPDFERDADVIKALWRAERRPDDVIDLSGNNRIPALLAERAEQQERIKAAKARCESIEAEIKFHMKDAAVAVGVEGWRVTYKTSHFKEYTVRERDSRVLRVYDHRVEG